MTFFFVFHAIHLHLLHMIYPCIHLFIHFALALDHYLYLACAVPSCRSNYLSLLFWNVLLRLSLCRHVGPCVVLSFVSWLSCWSCAVSWLCGLSVCGPCLRAGRGIVSRLNVRSCRGRDAKRNSIPRFLVVSVMLRTLAPTPVPRAWSFRARC